MRGHEKDLFKMNELFTNDTSLVDTHPYKYNMGRLNAWKKGKTEGRLKGLGIFTLDFPISSFDPTFLTAIAYLSCRGNEKTTVSFYTVIFVFWIVNKQQQMYAFKSMQSL